MNTIYQKELNFNLKITSDCITSKSGLIFFYETALAIGLIKEIDRIFPHPKSNNSILPKDYTMSIILMLCGGGKFMEDIRQIKIDNGLCKICEIKRVPSPDAIANWLKEENNFKRLNKVL